VLLDATDQYFKRKAAGQTKPQGETILVITDGEPDDRRAVMEVIVNASRKMERDEELAISIIQVGSDAGATKFLKALDDQLESVGAKFEFVTPSRSKKWKNLALWKCYCGRSKTSHSRFWIYRPNGHSRKDFGCWMIALLIPPKEFLEIKWFCFV
jgi:hypothetical protein